LLVIIGCVTVLLAAFAAFSLGAEQAEAKEAAAIERRSNRYETLASARERLRAELRREPTVREIFQATYADLDAPANLEYVHAVGLRERVKRVMEEAL